MITQLAQPTTYRTQQCTQQYIQQHQCIYNQMPMTEDSQIIGWLNHESRTALCIVLLTAEALQFDLFGPLTESQDEAVTKIRENAAYLQTLLENLLQFIHTGPEDARVG
jgi:K+-sensing histidine kinase KdpD